MDVISAAAKQSQIDDNDAVMDDATRRARLQKKGSHHLHLDLHELTAHQGHSHVVFWVSFDTTGRLLLTASGDKTVKLWNLQNRKVLATFFEHEQWVYSVCFFYNSMAFATGCDDGRVRIWENTTSPVNHETGWKLTCDLGGKHDSANGHRAGVHSVSVSADDAYVVSSSADMSIKLWRRVEKECFLTLRGHTDWVTRAVFDRDCLLMASASYDTHAKLWRLSDGDDLLTFYGHKSWVSDVAWGPEGRTIATASGDFTVRLWQAKRQDGMLADGLPLLILYGHKNWVLSVNFSLSGTKLCSSSADCTTAVWNVLTGELEHRLKQRSWVECAAFAPSLSGEQVVTCGHDVDVMLWSTAYDKPQVATVLHAKPSYLLLFYYWLRSRVTGREYVAPPLSHQRRAALRSLFDQLDVDEQNLVPASSMIQAIYGNALLLPLLANTENGASLMQGDPRTVLQSLTAWSLSGDLISWRHLLSIFEDPAAEGHVKRGSVSKGDGESEAESVRSQHSSFGFVMRKITSRATNISSGASASFKQGGESAATSATSHGRQSEGSASGSAEREWHGRSSQSDSQSGSLSASPADSRGSARHSADLTSESVTESVTESVDARDSQRRSSARPPPIDEVDE